MIFSDENIIKHRFNPHFEWIKFHHIFHLVGEVNDNHFGDIKIFPDLWRIEESGRGKLKKLWGTNMNDYLVEKNDENCLIWTCMRTPNQRFYHPRDNSKMKILVRLTLIDGRMDGRFNGWMVDWLIVRKLNSVKPSSKKMNVLLGILKRENCQD
jgi:hypothetical protein